MPTCQECDQDYMLDDGNDDDGLCHPCAHAIAGDRASSQVSARDLTIRDLRARVSELEDTIVLSAADDAIGRSYGRNTFACTVASQIRERRGQEWNGAEVAGLDSI